MKLAADFREIARNSLRGKWASQSSSVWLQFFWEA